ncbi:hypothetical protein [Asanoa sp. NPDC050611]|uniref:hypothetical protein n=1 Tax=Asanoa sp. NPDC050611 TaxID=3157098 RepID=UPI0033D26B6D
MRPETAYAVGRRYGIDLDDVHIRVRDHEVGYFGFTNSRQQVVLARDAFANEQEMARTLYHERYHVGQLRSGTPYPRTDGEAAGGLRGVPGSADVACPNCGQHRLRLVFTGDGVGFGSLWCDACLWGIFVSRAAIPEGATVLAPDLSEAGRRAIVPNYRIVPPDEDG